MFRRNNSGIVIILKKVGDVDIDWGTKYVRDHAPELGGIHIDWNKGIRIGDTEVELHLGQLKKSGRINPTWETKRGVYSLGTGISWLGKYINEIKIQALNTIFQFPGKASAEDFFKWVTANWYFLS